jgi:rRNA small subunit pseudouridine methyltransferase Nep1
LLNLVLAEASLELVPKALWTHPSVVAQAVRRGKEPEKMLLDRSYHHAAMRSIDDTLRRGRPDIIHLSLLEILGSPLAKEELVRVYVHTRNDRGISVSAKTRLPRDCNRFYGLIEQLFEYGRVPLSGSPLLEVRAKTFSQLLREIGPTRIFAFSRRGKLESLDRVAERIVQEAEPVVVVGAFPRGTYTDSTKSQFDETISMDPSGLETWIVVARILYEYEKAIGLFEKRASAPISDWP